MNDTELRRAIHTDGSDARICVHSYLANGGDVNSLGEHRLRPLVHEAIEGERRDFLEELVRAGASLLSDNSVGMPPLHYAFEYEWEGCQLETISPDEEPFPTTLLLLALGADPQCQSRDGQTFADYVRASGGLDALARACGRNVENVFKKNDILA